MRFRIVLALTCIATSAMAASGVDLAKMNKNFVCQMKVNQASMDMFVGMDPDGAAFAINPDGQTEVFDANRIVSRSTNNGVETIVYKSKEPRMDGNGKMIFETVRKTIEIKRQDGKIMSVNKLFDMKKQAEQAKQSNFMKMPLLKSMESTFVYDGDNCSVNQDISYQAKDEKSTVEAKVSFDKKFCDALTPIVKQMGSQNAAQCGNLFAQAQMAYDGRAKELKAEGKSFVDWSSYIGGKEGNKPNMGANMDLGSKIASCAMADQGGWGMGMYGGGMMNGMGMMSGGAMGMMMGGGMAPKAAPKANDAKAEKAVR